jgi:hypothetical protein
MGGSIFFFEEREQSFSMNNPTRPFSFARVISISFHMYYYYCYAHAPQLGASAMRRAKRPVGHFKERLRTGISALTMTFTVTRWGCTCYPPRPMKPGGSAGVCTTEESPVCPNKTNGDYGAR